MKVKISEIKIERVNDRLKRFRKDFGNIQQLVASLKKYGLIHPIVVDKMPEPVFYGDKILKGDPKFPYHLVAGERRITAALYLGWTEIDATVRSDLSSLERKEIELEENSQRKDITWIEQIEALRQLDLLKRIEHGSRQQGSIDPSGWTIQDTANSIGASIGTVSQDLKLARDLIEHPELRKKVEGSTKMVARKTVERELKAAVLRKQLASKSIIVSSSLIYGKAEEKIKDIPDNSISCLITDPPFGIKEISDVSKGNLSGKYDQGTNVGTKIEMCEVYEELLPELSRVMIDGAHFYMFFGPDFYDFLKRRFEYFGFLVDPVPIIWSKCRTTMIPNPYHYIPSYEMILYGCKAPRNRTLLKPCANCLTTFPADAPQKRIHSLQKPFDLMKLFIENSTSPGETVLDCFAGSGIVLKTAVALGRKAIGFECDEKNYLMANEFLNGE